MQPVCQFLTYLLLAAPVMAQVATLRGVVTDESGAVVPAARVLLTGQGAAVKSTASDGAGRYSFTGLTPGDYTVQASAPQLAQPQPARIALKAGVQTLNLRLSVAAIEERVTVQDTASTGVSTASGNNASALVLQGDDLDALSDNPDDLMADLQALAGPSAGPNGGAIFIDGFSGGELPAKDSIREIRINQNPFSPEYDKLGYGRIEIFTKPGADKYRGTADYNLGTQAWNSRNPYSPQKAHFLLNEFEGNAGGPLGKRASFTLDAQRNMVDNGAITNGVALDQSLAAAPFSSVTVIPGRFTRVSPRVDYQLNANHTLTFRYGVTRAGAQNVGVGSFDLPSRGYHNQFTNQTLQVAETAVLGAAVNETRFQYYRSATQMIAANTSPEVQVLGSFYGGGALVGRSFDTQNTFELQNYTSMLRGPHSWKFGIRARAQMEDSVSPYNFNGTFTFGGGGLAPVLDAANAPVLDPSGQPVLAPITSIERYRRTLLFQQLGYGPAAIRLAGGGATQFSINGGIPELAVHQVDVGIFAGDEWRVRPNVTLSLGLRYETQTNIHDWRDFAPRLAMAWAPGGGAKTRPKTVVRAGFGMFYDRFSLANTLTALRYNGVNQQQYVVANPDFFPTVPPLATLAAFQSTQTVQEVSRRLRSPYIMQSALTLERQLPRNTTLAVTYTNSHGLHVFRSEDINAPLPGTYSPSVRGSGVFPAGRPGPIFLMESAGLYNQNQVIANVNSKLNSGLSLFGFYVFNKSRSNTDGFATFPANPYDYSGEYGPAATDIRHRVTGGGSISLRWNVRISPFLVAQTGAPFDITAGSDLFGTTMFNGRPGIGTGAAKAGLIPTAYGLLDPNPAPGQPLLPRNYGRGPDQINFNLRIAKSVGFGRERGRSGGDQRPAASTSTPNTTSTAGMAAPIAGTGSGLRNIIGAPTTSRRYNLTIGMSIRNLLNHNNPGPIIGNITSPLFGRANQVAGAPNGEGFYETANNRRLESQIRFTF